MQVDKRTGKVGKALFRPADIAGGFDLSSVSAGPVQEAKLVASVRNSGRKGR